MTGIELHIDLESEQRDGMYEHLCEQFDKDGVHDVLEAECIDHITQMFDNREQLAETMEEQV